VLTDTRPGARHFSLAGLPLYDTPGLPADSDTAVDMRGIAIASRASDTGLQLAAFSLSFWFRAHTMPALIDPNESQIIIGKDASGLHDGDFTVFTEETGVVKAQFQSNTASFALSSPVVAEEIYHVCVRADNTGFDMYVNGKYVGKNTAYTTAWINNVNPLTIGVAPWAIVNYNGIVDEIALFPRILTEAEVFLLAQHVELPEAVGDSFTVQEGTTTVLNVVANDTFAGPKSGLTVTVVTSPGGGDTATPDANKDIVYVAGAVGATTARSFAYKITDPNGESNIATVNMTIQDVAAPPTGAENCYNESAADVVEIGTGSGDIGVALAAAILNAPAGRNILILPGTYTGGVQTFRASGTAAAKVIVRPKPDPLVGDIGIVTVNNANWTLADGVGSEGVCKHLVISKIYFNQSRVVLAGDNNRVARCRFRTISGTALQVGDNNGRHFRNCRISNCDFSEFTNGLSQHNPINVRNLFGQGNARNLLIDRCYFHDVNVEGINGTEIIGTYANVPGLQNPVRGETVTITHCLFSDWILRKPASAGGEGELITIKSAGWVVKFCTFLNTNLEVTFRTTRDTELRSCWFEGGDNIRVMGDDNLVIGNKVVGPDIMYIRAGNATTQEAIALSEPDGIGVYARCARNLVVGNVMDTGRIEVGFYPDAGIRQSAIDNVLEANSRLAGEPHYILHTTQFGFTPAQERTTIRTTTSHPYEAPVKLLPSQVGLMVPDQYCPTGT
jgi:hypothetical protein